jgi:hypothetical protein
MSLAFYASPINYENEDENKNMNNNRIARSNNNISNSNNSNSNSNSMKKNKTYKNNDPAKKIKKVMIQEAFNSLDDSDNDNVTSNLGNFGMPSQTIQHESYDSQVNNDIPNQGLAVAMNDNLANLDNAYSNEYYNQHVSKQENNPNENPRQYPYQNLQQTSYPPTMNNADLLRKLDMILHLLEEQHEEKTSYITEELILYVFLGIFIIYVLDSFVRVGKYTR